MSATNVPTATASRETARISGRANARRQRALALRGLYFLIALVGAVIMIFPVFWLISTALKPSGEVFTSPPILFPSHPQFHNFPDAVTSSALPDGNYFIYMWNTTWYTALVGHAPFNWD